MVLDPARASSLQVCQGGFRAMAGPGAMLARQTQHALPTTCPCAHGLEPQPIYRNVTSPLPRPDWTAGRPSEAPCRSTPGTHQSLQLPSRIRGSLRRLSRPFLGSYFLAQMLSTARGSGTCHAAGMGAGGHVKRPDHAW